MYLRKATAILLLGASSLIPVGCSRHSNDEAIVQDVQNKIAADPVTKDSAVTATADNGKVTLKGTAKDSAAQQRIEQIAHQEPGVTGVDDEVTAPPPLPEQAANAPVPAPVQQPEPPTPPSKPLVVPVGTELLVTVDQALSSKTSKSGQPFMATVARPVTIQGKTAIPKGSSVTGTVITAKEKGKIKGEGELVLSLTNITIHGRDYPIQTGTLDSTVKGKGKRSAATTGGGAAGGALVGGLAGGGKGAGIGAAVGAVGGLVGGAMTGNKQIEIPAESPLTFTLAKSIKLPPPSQ